MSGKVLYICGGRNFSSLNLGRKIYSVVKSWSENGFDVEHICGGDFNSSSMGNQKYTYGASDYHRRISNKYVYFKFLVNSVSEAKDIIHDKKMLREVRKRVLKINPDIVWERSSRLHKAGLIVSQELNIPYVLEWKDNLIPYKFSLFRLKAIRLEKQKIAQADYIVVESNALRKCLSASYSIPENKFIVAYNAVDATEFKRSEHQRKLLRKKFGFSNNTIVVGYVGSYAFYHDTIRIIESAKLIKDKRIKFLMVGNGKDYQKVRNLAKNYGLLDTQVFFIPPVSKEEVPFMLSAMDIAILPGSTDIICPIKVQEYMAMRLATIVPDYKCNREVVKHGKTGVLFIPFDQNSLANSVLDLARNKPLREELGISARKEIEENYSWNNTWVKALKEVFSLRHLHNNKSFIST